MIVVSVQRRSRRRPDRRRHGCRSASIPVTRVPAASAMPVHASRSPTSLSHGYAATHAASSPAPESRDVPDAAQTPSKRLIAQRLLPSTTTATEKHEGSQRIQGPFMQDVTAHRVQRPRVVQIHYPFLTGLGPHPTRVIVTFADHHPPTTVGNVFQLQTQHLTRPQPTIEHQQEDGQIPRRRHTAQQKSDVPVGERTWQSQRQPNPDGATDRLLPTRRAPRRCWST